MRLSSLHLATGAAPLSPLAGAPMATLAEGPLSGIGHSLPGFDHSFFAASGLGWRFL